MEERWGETGEVGDEALSEGEVKGGQGMGEQGSLGECNEFGWCGGSDGDKEWLRATEWFNSGGGDGVGRVKCHKRVGVRGSVSSEDNGVVDRHSNFDSGSKGNGAVSIAQLTHGDEGRGSKGRDIVNMAGNRREHG
jgi:hypothetical protein